MEEIWKPVVGYENLYDVSNIGRVKSLERILTDGRIWKERILKPEINHDYLRVRLCDGKYKKHKRIHILVAQAFIPNPDNLPEVNHKDENKQNNYINNLEWCTSEYNSNYGNCKLKIAKKLAKPIAQYTLGDELIKEFKSISDASRKTGYNIAPLSNCCNNKCEIAYGYKWKFITK